MLNLRNQAMFLVLAISFAAFPWEYVDSTVLEAAGHAACDADQLNHDQFNHDHGDHTGTEDPCGDDCGCLCCPGHGQFPSTASRLPAAPARALVKVNAPRAADQRGRVPLNDVFRPPRTI